MSASISAGAEHERDEELPELINHDHPRIVTRHRGLVLVAAMAGMTMQVLDTTIANVALPHMQSSLGATQDTVTWILTSYVLAAAVALPLTGWLVDRIGLRQLMIVSIALFTGASMLCGMAQSIEQMVMFRIMQGLAGAFLSPVAQTMMLDLSTPAERPRMMTLFTQGVMIGPIIGPVLGGYLTDNFSWRWVFYVNLPVGIGCIALLLLFMPRSPVRPRKFDVFGWAAVAVAVSSLQLMLDRGSQLDWFQSGEIFAYLVVAICAGWVAIVHITTAQHPLFPRELFRDRNFVASIALTTVFGVALMSTMALLPALLQVIYGYPPIDAGLLLIPRGVGTLITTTLFGSLIARGDPRLLLGLGFSILGLSMLLMSRWGPVMPASWIIGSGLLQGVGMALSFVPLNVIAFATLPDRLRTDASSGLNLMRNLGSSIGITVCTVMLTHSAQINHAELGERIDFGKLPVPFEQLSVSPGASETVLRVTDGLVNLQALMIGYNNDFLAMGFACFAMLPLLLILRRPKGLSAPQGSAAMADH